MLCQGEGGGGGLRLKGVACQGRGGWGGLWDPKIRVLEMAQRNMSFRQISFVPTLKFLGDGGVGTTRSA